ncbi:MAG: flavodoxin domain-containing protein [Candidatus Bathyarchaeota archaeon]|nr:flavodoxin domain-containing protein [Candidatus Bathyarchaeota archaeon]
MVKALIVYGTRSGSTRATAEDIAQTLRQEGLEAKVADAKKEKTDSIAQYDLVVVGSGIQINKWTGEPEKFLKKFQKELAQKKVALFVCCGSAATYDANKDPQEIEKARHRYLDEKAAKYNLQPIALGFFGGIYDYNNMSWIMKKFMEAERPKIAAAFKENPSGVYDTRNIREIYDWAKQLVKKTQT